MQKGYRVSHQSPTKCPWLVAVAFVSCLLPFIERPSKENNVRNH